MTNDEKQFYNSLVDRLHKAEKYMDDNSVAIEEREKWIPQLQGLMKDMHDIAKEFKLSEEEMLNGLHYR